MSGKQLTEPEFDGIAYRKWIELENRKAWWRGRAAKQMAKDFCFHCHRQKYCGRLRINDLIIIDVLTGKGCYDYIGVWTDIFNGRKVTCQ